MSVPAFLLPALIKTGLDFDVDTVAILGKHGIDLQTLPLDSGRVPAEHFNAVMLELVEVTQNPALGMSFAHHFSYDYIPEIESFLLSVSTLREAMLAYRWMAELFGSVVSIKFESDDQLFSVKLTFVTGTPHWVARLFAECSFSLVSRLAFLKAGADFRIRRVGFTHNDKAAAPIYKNFFRCPVSIDQECYSLSISLEDADKPLEQHSPALKSLSRFQIEQRISRLTGEKTLTDSISTMLMQHPYLMANGIEECACRLYLTPRTLQRKLKEQGTSYRRVLEQVRQQLAKQHLKGNASLDRISELLCFSDRRSFTRAFQKWEGITPSIYRKRSRLQT